MKHIPPTFIIAGISLLIKLRSKFHQTFYHISTSSWYLLFFNLVSNHWIKRWKRERGREEKTDEREEREPEPEEINPYPRNGGAMSCTSELMIFPVTALYLFVSWSSFTREKQCIGSKADGKYRYAIVEVNLIKDLPHKSILSIVERNKHVFHGLVPPYIERNVFFAFKWEFIRRDCTFHSLGNRTVNSSLSLSLSLYTIVSSSIQDDSGDSYNTLGIYVELLRTI